MRALARRQGRGPPKLVPWNSFRNELKSRHCADRGSGRRSGFRRWKDGMARPLRLTRSGTSSPDHHTRPPPPRPHERPNKARVGRAVRIHDQAASPTRSRTPGGVEECIPARRRAHHAWAPLTQANASEMLLNQRLDTHGQPKNALRRSSQRSCEATAVYGHLIPFVCPEDITDHEFWNELNHTK